MTILVHSSPQIMILAIYFDEHLIEVPLISGSGSSAAQLVSVCLAELERPFTDRFVSNDYPTHSHYFFNVAVAEGEAEVKPHSVANDFGRKPMTPIEGNSCVHQPIMQHVLICFTLGSLS